MCGKGGAPTTQTASTNQNVAYTPAGLNNFQDIYKRASDAANTPYQAYGGQMTAGLDPMQQQGMNQIAGSAGQAQGFINQGAGMVGQGTAMTGQGYNTVGQGVGVANSGLGYIGQGANTQNQGQGMIGQGANIAQGGLGYIGAGAGMTSQGNATAQQGNQYLQAGAGMVGQGSNISQSGQQDMNLGANTINQGNIIAQNGQGFFNQGAGMMGQGFNTAQQGQQYFGAGAGMMGAGAGLVGMGTGQVNQAGQPIGSQQIDRYLNPYQRDVTNATMANINETNAQQQQQLQGNAAMQGALGGDRSAVAGAELARQQGLASNQTLAGLNQANYQTALQTAMNQQQAGMQAGQATIGAGSQLSQIGSQTANVGSQQGQLGSQMGALGSQTANVGSQFGQLGSQVGALGSQQANVGSQLGQLGATVSNQGTQMAGVGSQFGNLGAQQSNMGSQMAGYGGMQANIGQGVGALGGQMVNAGSQQAALAGQQANIGSQIGALGSQQMGAGAAMGNLGGQYAGLGQAAQNAAIQGGQATMGAGAVGQQTQQAALTAQYQQFLQKQAFPYQQAQFLAQTGLPAAGAMGGYQTQIGNTGQVMTPPGMSWPQGIVGGGALFGGLGGAFGGEYRGGRIGENPYAAGGSVSFDQALGQPIQRFEDGGMANPWDAKPVNFMGGSPGSDIKIPDSMPKPIPMTMPSMPAPQQQPSLLSQANGMLGAGKGLKSAYNGLSDFFKPAPGDNVASPLDTAQWPAGPVGAPSQTSGVGYGMGPDATVSAAPLAGESGAAGAAEAAAATQAEAAALPASLSAAEGGLGGMSGLGGMASGAAGIGEGLMGGIGGLAGGIGAGIGELGAAAGAGLAGIGEGIGALLAFLNTGGRVGAYAEGGDVDHLGDAPQTIPESEATLKAQQQDLLAGRRPAQMFPSGTPELPTPQGMGRTQTPEGVFHYDPSKLNETAIHAAVKSDKVNDILNLGPISKNEVMHRVQQFGEKPVTVVERGPDGTELRAAAGTEKTAPVQLAYMYRTQTPGSSIKIEDIRQTLAQRTAGKQQFKRGGMIRGYDDGGEVDTFADRFAPAESIPQAAPVLKDENPYAALGDSMRALGEKPFAHLGLGEKVDHSDLNNPGGYAPDGIVINGKPGAGTDLSASGPRSNVNPYRPPGQPGGFDPDRATAKDIMNINNFRDQKPERQGIKSMMKDPDFWIRTGLGILGADPAKGPIGAIASGASGAIGTYDQWSKENMTAAQKAQDLAVKLFKENQDKFAPTYGATKDGHPILYNKKGGLGIDAITGEPVAPDEKITPIRGGANGSATALQKNVEYLVQSGIAPTKEAAFGLIHQSVNSPAVYARLVQAQEKILMASPEMSGKKQTEVHAEAERVVRAMQQATTKATAEQPAPAAAAPPATAIGARQQFKQGWGTWDGSKWVPDPVQ